MLLIPPVFLPSFDRRDYRSRARVCVRVIVPFVVHAAESCLPV